MTDISPERIEPAVMTPAAIRLGAVGIGEGDKVSLLYVLLRGFESIGGEGLDHVGAATDLLNKAALTSDASAIEGARAEERDRIIAIMRQTNVGLEPPDGGDPTPRQMIENIIAEITIHCEDCPPADYPTDATRCTPCPLRSRTPVAADRPAAPFDDLLTAIEEAVKPHLENPDMDIDARIGRPIIQAFNRYNEAAASILKPRTPVAAEADKGLIETHGLDNQRQVFFYEQDFYVLSNFSSFQLGWNGLTFPTSEHAYHCQKFSPRSYAYESIRIAPSAHEAFKIAEIYKEYRRIDWDDVKVDIMRDILRAKAAQHEYVRRKLLATGDRELIENSWRDDFWGWGPNRDGKNMLGMLWMEIRAELRAAPPSISSEGV